MAEGRHSRLSFTRSLAKTLRSFQVDLSITPPWLTAHPDSRLTGQGDDPGRASARHRLGLEKKQKLLSDKEIVVGVGAQSHRGWTVRSVPLDEVQRVELKICSYRRNCTKPCKC